MEQKMKERSYIPTNTQSATQGGSQRLDSQDTTQASQELSQSVSANRQNTYSTQEQNIYYDTAEKASNNNQQQPVPMERRNAMYER
jgi:hypothetical protein